MGDEVGRTTAWFYCLRHNAVEPEGHCKAKYQVGPYPDPESAAQALQSIREREDRLEQEDRTWAGDGDSGE